VLGSAVLDEHPSDDEEHQVGPVGQTLTHFQEAVYWSAVLVALVPFGVTTVTSTVPAAKAGDVETTVVSELTAKSVAAMVPKLTAVAPVKPEPLTVTEFPPATEPVEGEMLVTTGALPGPVPPPTAVLRASTSAVMLATAASMAAESEAVPRAATAASTDVVKLVTAALRSSIADTVLLSS
jgi:hypothetical protein